MSAPAAKKQKMETTPQPPGGSGGSSAAGSSSATDQEAGGVVIKDEWLKLEEDMEAETQEAEKAKEKSVLIRARRMPRTWPDYVMVAASALATRRKAVSEPKLYKFVAEEFPASVEGRKEAHCKKFLKKALAKLTEEGELKRVKNSYVLAC
jgi:hypothetical protein